MHDQVDRSGANHVRTHTVFLLEDGDASKYYFKDGDFSKYYYCDGIESAFVHDPKVTAKAA